MSRLIVLLLAACALLAAQKHTMELRLEFAKQDFLLKESLRVTVVLRNTGSSPVEVPEIADSRNRELTYTLAGPSFPEPHAFDYAGRDGLRLDEPAATRRLAPGESFSRAITIESQAEHWKPGPHTLSAAFAAGELHAEAAPVTFTLHRPELLAAEAMLDLTPQTSPFLRIEFLARAGDVPRLYQAFFPEVLSDAEEIPAGSFSEVAPAPPAATRVLAPWTNFPRQEALFARYGWQAPGAVGWLDALSRPAAGARLDAPIEWLRPALLRRDATVSIYGWRGRDLAGFTFPPAAAPPQPEWRMPLPAEPVAGRAALGPEASGSPRAVLVIFQSLNELRLAVITMAGGQPQMRLERIPGAAPLAGSQPSLAFTDAGGLRAAVLAQTPGDPRELRLVELRWPLTPEGAGPARFEVGDPVAAPGRVEAAAAVAPSPGGAPGTLWAALLEDGRILSSLAPATPRRPGGAVIVPLQLLPRPGQTLILLKDGDNVPFVEQLR